MIVLKGCRSLEIESSVLPYDLMFLLLFRVWGAEMEGMMVEWKVIQALIKTLFKDVKKDEIKEGREIPFFDNLFENGRQIQETFCW